VRHSFFWQLMDEEFGPAYSRSVAADQSLAELGGKTVETGFAAGHSPREVWHAVCESMDVPPERRRGRPQRAVTGSRGRGEGA